VGEPRWFANHNHYINSHELAKEEEMKRSKKYIAAAEKVKQDHLYTPLEAVTLAKETSVTKYDSTIEVALVLGVDPKKADQAIRGTVNLPHGTGKTARVLVFANGERAEEARAAGADIVGGDELIDEVSKGRLDFDAVVATRGLMPNPKTGTVTTDVTKAVKDIKGGKIEFRVDKNSNLHYIIGKVSFTAEQLADNYAAAMDEVLRAKPNSSKGRYVQKAVISTSMGPGIAVDPNLVREPSAN
jgi:large subunit ribosomal protein L1